MPEGPIPRTAREPAGATKAGLALLGLVLAAGTVAWLVAIVLQLVDFLSADCKLLGCAGHKASEHVRAYGEALIGLTGVVVTARAAYRSFRLIHAYGHMVTLRRGVLSALALLVVWSVLLGSG
jgi:hypothetical protein